MKSTLHKFLLGFSLFVVCLPFSRAAEFQYYLVPLKGVTGISQSALKNIATEGPKYGGMINEQYADFLFDVQTQQSITSNFSDLVGKAYPKAVLGPSQIVASGKSGSYLYDKSGICSSRQQFQVGYQHAYAISIGISRLSAYANDYGDKTQLFVPITYTIRLVKINGASIVFSKSQTIWTNYDSSSREFYDSPKKEISASTLQKVKEIVIKDSSTAIALLLEAAVKSFNPKQTEVKLVGRDGPYYIFDRGSEIGFKKGQEFDATDQANNEYGFEIKYASDRVAIGVPSLTPGYASPKRLSNDAKLNFNFESPGVDDAKLSILAVQYSTEGQQGAKQQQILDNALGNILVDNLGFTAPFNILKVDPDFQRLKIQIKSEINCDPEMYTNIPGFADTSTIERADPDLLLKVDHFDSPLVTVTGVGGVTTNVSFNNAVSLSLLDMAGVVRQNFTASENYLLSQTNGKGLSPQQAKEVNLTNAGTKALKQLVAGFGPKKKLIKVLSVQSGVATLDSNISPASFNQFRLARPINFNKRQVLLPILNKGDDGVVFDEPADSSNKLNYRGDLKVGDFLIQQYSSDGASQANLCERNGIFLLTPNLKNPSGVDRLMRYSVGSGVKNYDFIEESSTFVSGASTALKDGFFNTKQITKPTNFKNCLLPVEMQQITKISCSSGKCTGTASIGSGVRIFSGDTKIAESVVGASFDFNEIPEAEVSRFVGLKLFEHHIKSTDAHKSKLK
jgi:hypothetical protein